MCGCTNEHDDPCEVLPDDTIPLIKWGRGAEDRKEDGTVVGTSDVDSYCIRAFKARFKNSIQPRLIAAAPFFPHSSILFTSRLSRGHGSCVTVRRCKIFPVSISKHLTEPCLFPTGPRAMQLRVRSVLSFVTTASVLAST